jgi:hypothetical protein
VDQVVQGSPEALGPKWLTGNRHRPYGLVWSGEDNLCGGRGDPLPWWRSSLVEAASRWLDFVASEVALLGETW